MLVRLQVDGFKNLRDVDLQLGPFTCFAGANGVGKSNVFDALLFLSALAHRPLAEAALSVRDAGALGGDVAGVFFQGGKQEAVREIKFRVELILPGSAIDDLGQRVKAATTFVAYSLRLRLNESGHELGGQKIEIVEESLKPIRLGDATKRISFLYSRAWLKSTLNGRRTTPFISTETDNERGPTIYRHQDGNSGRKQGILASTLPRTLLSDARGTESPTAVVVKRELQSWRLLQLEPSSLRQADEYDVEPYLSSSGRHLPTALYRMGRLDADAGEPGATLASIATDLNNLVRATRELTIERDDARRLTTLYLHDVDGERFPARALSDGTLRFLALLALDIDPAADGLICLEEPENGIHPERVRTILDVMKRMATDPTQKVDDANPLRQIIINTHSPVVVTQLHPGDLVVIRNKKAVIAEKVYTLPGFYVLPDTWRADSLPEVTRAALKKYIGSTPVARRRARLRR